jgi:hypothetical protein
MLKQLNCPHDDCDVNLHPQYPSALYGNIRKCKTEHTERQVSVKINHMRRILYDDGLETPGLLQLELQ